MIKTDTKTTETTKSREEASTNNESNKNQNETTAYKETVTQNTSTQSTQNTSGSNNNSQTVNIMKEKDKCLNEGVIFQSGTSSARKYSANFVPRENQYFTLSLPKLPKRWLS